MGLSANTVSEEVFKCTGNTVLNDLVRYSSAFYTSLFPKLLYGLTSQTLMTIKACIKACVARVVAPNLRILLLVKADHVFHGPHGLALCAWKMSAMECISRENWWRMVSILPISCLCIPPPPLAASFEKLPSSWQAALALFSFLRSRRMPCSAPLKRAGKEKLLFDIFAGGLATCVQGLQALALLLRLESAPRATGCSTTILVICRRHDWNCSRSCRSCAAS